MEKFTIDLDKVLDDFEFNEGNFYIILYCTFFLCVFDYNCMVLNINFCIEREQLQASISNERSHTIPTIQVINKCC